MSDKSAAALREIASLLKKQLVLQEKQAKAGEKRMKKFKVPKMDDFKHPDFSQMEAKADRQRAEDVAHREALLKAIERHNDLLLQLLTRSA